MSYKEMFKIKSKQPVTMQQATCKACMDNWKYLY